MAAEVHDWDDDDWDDGPAADDDPTPTHVTDENPAADDPAAHDPVAGDPAGEAPAAGGATDTGRRHDGPGGDPRPGDGGPRPADDWEEVPEVVAPGPAPHRPSPSPVGVRCPDCAAVVPAGTAACPACLAPAGAPGRRSGAGGRPERLPGGVLRLVFRGGGRHLDVPRGAELRLGRSSTWAPQASALLAGEETVSGRHATVAHTADGAAWVTEVAQGATNGTRVNDRVLVPDRAVRLRNGDRVDLGPRVGFVVRGIEDEPAGPAG
ncbi:FHA domain-containing protein [Streptomyces sp. NRRL S-1022]|uniref:FHA domain-containing protein n=1 Tax=Streptomyces sp. NRRL S-1022 TaxID=1463880 RepID=UPI000ACFC9C2|nr:FHA domain-containing protein [Streptomyces sp. NRRL S-1022]